MWKWKMKFPNQEYASLANILTRSIFLNHVFFWEWNVIEKYPYIHSAQINSNEQLSSIGPLLKL